MAAENSHYETCEVLLRAGISKDSRTKVERYGNDRFHDHHTIVIFAKKMKSILFLQDTVKFGRL